MPKPNTLIKAGVKIHISYSVHPLALCQQMRCRFDLTHSQTESETRAEAIARTLLAANEATYRSETTD